MLVSWDIESVNSYLVTGLRSEFQVFSHLADPYEIISDTEKQSKVRVPISHNSFSFLTQLGVFTHTAQCKSWSILGDHADLQQKLPTLFRYGDLYEHQREILFDSLKYSGYGFFDETGAGKTPPAIAHMEFRACFNHFRRFILFCKPILIPIWDRAIREWSENLVPVPLFGKIPDRVELLK